MATYLAAIFLLLGVGLLTVLGTVGNIFRVKTQERRLEQQGPRPATRMNDTSATPVAVEESSASLADPVSLADEIERLTLLHRNGDLTDDEFRTAKARVISEE